MLKFQSIEITVQSIELFWNVKFIKFRIKPIY